MGLRIVAPKKKELQAGSVKAPAAQTTSDGYLDRIVKYIPSQVITFYTALTVWLANPSAAPAAVQAPTTIPTNPADSGPELWVAFVAGLGLTLFLTYWQTREAGKPPAYLHILISSVAFLVYAYATGGPFVGTGWWKPGWAAGVLALFVIIIGTVAPPTDQTAAQNPGDAPANPAVG